MNANMGACPQVLTSLIPASVQPIIYYIGLAFLAFLVLYGLVMLLKKLFGGRTGESSENGEDRANADASDPAKAGNPDDAAIAAAIAASIVVTEDQALTAAITAAVAVYLELENDGKSALPTGFRVVSFKRRGSGAWNRVSK